MNSELISIERLSESYNVSPTLFKSLHSFDLIEIISNEAGEFIAYHHIGHIEKLLRLHFDLEINIENLDIINNLLSQIKHLKKENILLRNKLRFYE